MALFWTLNAQTKFPLLIGPYRHVFLVKQREAAPTYGVLTCCLLLNYLDLRIAWKE